MSGDGGEDEEGCGGDAGEGDYVGGCAAGETGALGAEPCMAGDDGCLKLTRMGARAACMAGWLAGFAR